MEELLLQTGGTDNLLLQSGDDLLLQETTAATPTWFEGMNSYPNSVPRRAEMTPVSTS